MTFDPELVNATFEFFDLPGDGLLELRAIDPRPGGGIVGLGFFDDPNAAIEACRTWNGTANVYVGVQRRPVSLRDPTRVNRIETGARGAHDDDIADVRSIVLDIDPERPKGTSATDMQREDARAAAWAVQDWLESKGWARGVRCDSGNGAYVWLAVPAIPLPRNPHERWRVGATLRFFEAKAREVVAGLGLAVRVDSIANPSRIIKVMGTLSVKGDVHRVAAPIDELFREEDPRLRDALLSVGEAVLARAFPEERRVDVADLGSADVPERFHMDASRDPKIAMTWAGTRPDLPDQSGSALDLALMTLCARSEAAYSDAELAAILRAYPYGKTRRREDYVARTIAKARTWVEKAAVETDPLVKRIAAAPETDLEGLTREVFDAAARMGTEKRSEAFDALAARLGVSKADVRARYVDSAPEDPFAGIAESARYRGNRYLWRDGVTFAEQSVAATGRNEMVPIANFCIHIERDEVFDDEVERRRVLMGHFERASVDGGGSYPFRIEAPVFESNQEFARAIGSTMGSAARYDDKHIGAIRASAKALSRPEHVEISGRLGWSADGAVYLTPSVAIGRDGSVGPNTVTRIEFGSRSQCAHLDLRTGDEDAVRGVADHIVGDLLELTDHDVTYALAGHAFMAPFLSLVCDGTIPKTILWLHGTTGKGKTFLARLFQSFYGDFTAPGSIETWASTPKKIQAEGWYFADALFTVDDFKFGAIPRNRLAEYVGVLQNYADGTGRGRLHSSGKRAGWSYSIRGNLLVTGEDVPSGEASILARSIVLAMPNRDKDLTAGARCRERCVDYPLFTSAFIAWVARSATESGSTIRERLRRAVIDEQGRFYAIVAGRQNDSRIATNLALNAAGFRLFTAFLARLGAVSEDVARDMLREHGEALTRTLLRQAALVESEQASTVFLETLKALLATGAVAILDDGSTIRSGWGEYRKADPQEVRNAVAITKASAPGVVFVVPARAVAEVRKAREAIGAPFNFTADAVEKQLFDENAIDESAISRDSNSRKVVKVGRYSTRAWPIKSSFLLGDEDSREGNEERYQSNIFN